MQHKDPFRQFLRDSGVKVSKHMLVMGLPYIDKPYKARERSKTTQNSPIPNKF